LAITSSTSTRFSGAYSGPLEAHFPGPAEPNRSTLKDGLPGSVRTNAPKQLKRNP
jgi:hypothetical protein